MPLLPWFSSPSLPVCVLNVALRFVVGVPGGFVTVSGRDAGAGGGTRFFIVFVAVLGASPGASCGTCRCFDAPFFLAVSVFFGAGDSVAAPVVPVPVACFGAGIVLHAHGTVHQAARYGCRFMCVFDVLTMHVCICWALFVCVSCCMVLWCVLCVCFCFCNPSKFILCTMGSKTIFRWLLCLLAGADP